MFNSSSDQEIPLDTHICWRDWIVWRDKSNNRIESRITEAEKLGYKQIIVSKYNKFNDKTQDSSY